jgi:peptidyl-prolyl cis-trans isomerase A (cyclophilin A)
VQARVGIFIFSFLGLADMKKLFSSALLATGLFLAASGAWAQDKVKFATSMGDIVVELDAAKAPKTVANFEQYVKDKHYDGTIFHRVIDGFMIQGGGMNAQMQEKKTREPIALEANNGLKNTRGTIAMARTMDPNSATAQFFINVKDNDFLNAAPGNDGYTVFGKVVQGMDVVDKIKAVATGNAGMHQNVPNQPILIKWAVLQEAAAAKGEKKAATQPGTKPAAKPPAPKASAAAAQKS